MAAMFEVKESHGQYGFRRTGGNGWTVASGEAFATKTTTHERCEAVTRAAAAATIKDVEAKPGM